MPEINNDTNIVEALRSKTEETDMKQYLKKTLGGYTQKSVLEYLNILRKQQQAMADTFNRNQQILFEEKESLKKENDYLKIKLMKVDSEYHNLSESMRSSEIGNEQITAADIAALKNKIAALEEELNKSDIEKSGLESQIDQHNIVINELTNKLEQATTEKQAVKEMLKTEMQESKNQRSIVARLTGTIEEKENEIKFLKSVVFEGQVEELTAKVNELTQQLDKQTEVMASCNNSIILKQQTIDTLTQENDTMKHTAAHLSKTLEVVNSQNEKIMSVNKGLTLQLESEYRKILTLIGEKSVISIDKLTASKKLDEANSKITMLELQLQKYANNKETLPNTSY